MAEKFPENFLWGTAVSSYQTEGNNVNSDWWEWEQKGKTKDKSGRACDYWNRYKEDHNLVSELGCNAFRLSLEWSRIEPEEGKFSDEAIRHYREMLEDLKSRNIKTIVTLWHWTSPIWFSEKYGLDNEKSIEIFLKYGRKVIDELGDLFDVVVTLSEPMMPLVFGFLIGKYPPGKKNPVAYKKAFNNLVSIHKGIYGYIKSKKQNLPVGVTMLYDIFEPRYKFCLLQKMAAIIAKKFWNDSFFEKIKTCVDYYGLDYYLYYQLSYFGRFHGKRNLSDMGWDIYPEGIYKALYEIYSRYKIPIYIMENGIADREDKFRSNFIKDHIKQVKRAIENGADVRGYCYWSLLDNYEWLYGYKMRFGLVEIDYKTLERKPRKSFYEYQKIIKSNGLNI